MKKDRDDDLATLMSLIDEATRIIVWDDSWPSSEETIDRQIRDKQASALAAIAMLLLRRDEEAYNGWLAW